MRRTFSTYSIKNRFWTRMIRFIGLVSLIIVNAFFRLTLRISPIPFLSYVGASSGLRELRDLEVAPTG